jgi:hypothetical protein
MLKVVSITSTIQVNLEPKAAPDLLVRPMVFSRSPAKLRKPPEVGERRFGPSVAGPAVFVRGLSKMRVNSGLRSPGPPGRKTVRRTPVRSFEPRLDAFFSAHVIDHGLWDQEPVVTCQMLQHLPVNGLVKFPGEQRG